MFGVCDGHGVNGHLVSDFVKKNLPRILSTLINQIIGPFVSGIKQKKNRDGSLASIKQKRSLVKDDITLPPLVKGSK